MIYLDRIWGSWGSRTNEKGRGGVARGGCGRLSAKMVTNNYSSPVHTWRNPHQVGTLFPHHLNLWWSYDLFWPIEWGEHDILGLPNTSLKALIPSAFTLGRKLLSNKIQEKEGPKDEQSCEERSQIDENWGVLSESQHQNSRQVSEAILILQPQSIHPANTT